MVHSTVWCWGGALLSGHFARVWPDILPACLKTPRPNLGAGMQSFLVSRRFELLPWLSGPSEWFSLWPRTVLSGYAIWAVENYPLGRGLSVDRSEWLRPRQKMIIVWVAPQTRNPVLG